MITEFFDENTAHDYHKARQSASIEISHAIMTYLESNISPVDSWSLETTVQVIFANVFKDDMTILRGVDGVEGSDWLTNASRLVKVYVEDAQTLMTPELSGNEKYEIMNQNFEDTFKGFTRDKSTKCAGWESANG